MPLKLMGLLRAVVVPGVLLLLIGFEVMAENPNPESGGQPAAPNLAASQEAIELRYRRFEGTLQQLSEYLRKTDPARAELLLRAVGKSKEGRIPEQLNHLTDLLKKDQLGDAVERQELVVAELQSLLELLMSEARRDDLDREKKRIQELIKDVNKLISKETDARAETERGGNNSELQNQQKQVADSTQKLVQKMEAQDSAKRQGKSGDKPNQDSNQQGKPSSDKAPSDQKEDNDNPRSDQGQKPDEGQPKTSDRDTKPADADKDKQPGSEKDKQPGDKKSGDNEKNSNESGKPQDAKSQETQKGDPKSSKPQNGKPSDGKPQQGKPQKGQQQEGQQQDQQSPDGQKQDNQQSESPDDEQSPKKQPEKTAGRDEVERAKKEMDRAIEELKKNNRKNASDKQDKAIAELMKAREKLEEILRQLREEEKELVLAQMEARFRDMLLKQETVNNATLAIHAVDAEHRTDRHRNRAVELARNEDEITLLASKALTLLKEEGSSIAFPEAVEQIRDDMQTIARRLDRVDVGEITQNIEQDTVESLKEILEALQRELEKMKDKKQQSQQQRQDQQQPHQQSGLVNKLAEMKMLRSLQYRVNRRTKQLARLVEGEQAVDPDIVSQLKQLSDRQAKVQKTTYDLATGKNQ